ncbi:hypothetical protein HPB47_019515 [Ixodes persulcatus]|uniref:Uncharacterized protein n=1 Tax=Ixodes persulcatus TaxID=34615 RepID=A0AC60QIU2_IXOPE|nr:hypothetical protein HPB47_019515 [Ixodes persulcatus]
MSSAPDEPAINHEKFFSQDNTQEIPRVKHTSRPPKRCRPAESEDSLDDMDEDAENRVSENIDDSTRNEDPWNKVQRERNPKPPRGTHLQRFGLEKFIISIKPKGSKDITKIRPKIIYQQLLRAAGSGVLVDRLIFTTNAKTNSITVTVYERKHLENILRIREIETTDGTVEVNTYQATTGSLPRGVVHGIDPLESVEEFLENSDTDYHEILQARPLGKKGTYFLGHKAGICTNESRCKDCGDLCQEGHKCQKLFCYNCKGNDHVALHQLCPAKTQADLKLQQRAKAPLLNNQQRGRLRSKFEGINSFELLRTRSQSNNYPKLSRDKSTSPAPKPKAPQKTATNAQPTFAQIMKDHRKSTLQLTNKRKEYEKLRKKLKEEENNLSRAAMERQKEIAMVQEEIDRIDRCSKLDDFSEQIPPWERIMVVPGTPIPKNMGPDHQERRRRYAKKHNEEIELIRNDPEDAAEHGHTQQSQTPRKKPKRKHSWLQ